MSHMDEMSERIGAADAPSLQAFTGGATRDWGGKPKTYYDISPIKKAPWGWEIILYFFLGGIAGTSYLIATLAHFLGGEQDANLTRAGRYLSFLAIAISPILLILDLGRPERFHHMLRVIKFRSVMSLGTWGITLFGICSGYTAAYQAAQDGVFNRLPVIKRGLIALPVKGVESIGSVLGLFVASYTGVLLSSTAVPLWGRAKHILGPLFLTSGLSAALASLSIILSPNRSNQKTLEKLEDAEILALTTELGFMLALPSLLGPLGKPLVKGKLGLLFVAGAIGGGILLPLRARLSWRLKREHMPRSTNSGLAFLTLLGSLILRTVWVLAGRRSADDPQATHRQENNL
jgi:formate-dependent nitrite reductase membrane component NrfD